MSIEKIAAGEYTLHIDIRDPATDRTITKQTTFCIMRADSVPTSYASMPYYDRIEYFLSSSDYRAFLDLPVEGKRIYLEKFWTTMDYNEIANRFIYADENFQQGAKPGSKTDRGRVYIKYGAPDEREKSFIEYQESKPYEHWQYFNGDQFVFVDIRGTSEYTLVWTNAPGETSQPTLYKYLPEELRDIVH
jgi:GWxTD domain-containing protein